MDKLLASMRERMPWTVASAILKSINLAPGQGWNNTVKKLTGDKFDEFKGPLADAIESHNLCGEKYTKIYKIEKGFRDALQSKILGFKIADGAAKNAYPLTLPVQQIKTIENVPHLVSIVKNTDGVGAIFTQAIKIIKREKIDIQEFFAHPQEVSQQYDEIVGLKYRSVQLFNVIWVPHDSDYVEIRTDMPDGMAADAIHAVQSQMKKTFNAFSLCQIDDSIDMFPVLEEMYDDADEGHVVELGFSTTSASVKHEKMRRAGLDLRTEPYHIAGKEGLGTPIEPFRLSIRWYKEEDNVKHTPELGLIGTARGKATIGAPRTVSISGAIVRNCPGRADYEFVISRIRHHLCQIAKSVEN